MSKSFLGLFVGLLVFAACVQAQAAHPLTLSEVLQSARNYVGDMSQPDVQLDPDKLRQAALSARPDYLAALEQVRNAEADVRLADATDITAGARLSFNLAAGAF